MEDKVTINLKYAYFKSKKLGSGAYGDVYEGLMKGENKLVAVKKLKIDLQG